MIFLYFVIVWHVIVSLLQYHILHNLGKVKIITYSTSIKRTAHGPYLETVGVFMEDNGEPRESYRPSKGDLYPARFEQSN